MNLSLYIARRLYSSNSKTRRASRPAVRIATVGVAIGVAVMLLATAVALGFKDEISSKVIGFGAHVAIYDAASSPEQSAIPINAGDSLLNAVKSVPNVKHVQTFCTKSGILKTENDFSGITLKGVGANYDTSFIQSHIIEGEMPDFSKAGSANDIVVSYNTAKTLNLKTGDKVFAYFFENGLRTRRLKISAIYRTDLSQFDNVIVFANQSTVARLNGFTGNQVSGMEILLHDFSRLNETSLKISKQTSYYNVYHNTQYVAFNIKESYPQIFEWLDLLNINIVVILLLMILVAGVTIVSGLLILILERTGTIAMLKSIGATNTLVRRTFINLALIILLKGMLWGNIIGLALAFVQKEWGIVSLDPESYYIDSVPIEFSLPIILAVNVTTFVVSTMALVLPSWLAARIRPSKILRFE
jgi:lipoprotein-releasing system permease protein